RRMKTIAVDVAIIGAGTAGLTARREAAKRAAAVVLIEGGPEGNYRAGGGRIDGRALLERVRSERDLFLGFVLDSVDKIPSAQRLRGHARFVEPSVVHVDDHTRAAARAG